MEESKERTKEGKEEKEWEEAEDERGEGEERGGCNTYHSASFS